MRILLMGLATLLAGSAVPCCAETKFVQYSHSPIMDASLAPTTLRAHGEYIEIWVRYVFSRALPTPEPEKSVYSTYRATEMLEVVDCPGHRSKLLKVIFYADKGARLPAYDEDQNEDTTTWNHPAPDSLGDLDIKYTCLLYQRLLNDFSHQQNQD